MNVIWQGFEFAIGFMLSIVVLFRAFMWLRFSWYSAKKIDGALYSNQIPVDVRISMLRKILKQTKRAAPNASEAEKEKMSENLMALLCSKDNNVPTIIAAVQKEFFEALHVVKDDKVLV